MAGRGRIREKGGLSVKIVSYSVAIFFILSSIVPLVWMISSSMKDNISIYSFPPKWIPEVPKTVSVTLNYDGADISKPEEYELDAMEAIWFTWKRMQNEAVGAMKVTGVKDGVIVYKASMPAYNFTVGRPQIVPTMVATHAVMKNKLAKIRAGKLTSFDFKGDGDKYTGSTEIAAELPLHATNALKWLTESKVVKGKVLTISEVKDWRRLFDNYIVLWKKSGDESKGANFGFPHFLLNSVIVTGSTIILQLLIGGTAGYALAHLVRSKVGTWLTLFFVATIMIPEIAILVPLYLTMDKLHLVNSLWGIILPHTAWGIVIFLFKGFFEQLPGELLQAGRIDGASEFKIFWRIIVPMSAPIFTVVAVMTFIAVWNEFLWPLVVARTQDVWTFTVALNDFQQRQSMGSNVIMSSLVIATIPLMLIITSCQKLIEKGVSFTGLKG
ncbi:carbohydrate ABC transporter permease [Paenibacillus lignilyticus]|uniref:Carbohydrate ABC transporter permease n=1 Tax=Paenibacillus lignilyticus TaxID=1172615 RepID=A0ABS5CIL7_9BACL|nr:carbohydrate ABC transporter permease [Paenibacillus lignilyticus]MBP3965649.1 carbohydrate ABC transporter permease [Paenibacillus lignilyticus]